MGKEQEIEKLRNLLDKYRNFGLTRQVEEILDAGYVLPVLDAERRERVIKELHKHDQKVLHLGIPTVKYEEIADSILALTQPTLPSLPPKELIAVFRKFRDGSINTENLNLDEQDKWKAELCLETLKAAGYEEKK